MALDQATTDFLTAAAEQGGPALHEMTPDEARAMSAGLADLYGPGPEMASVVDETLDTGTGATFPVRVFRPTESPDGVLVYYHGGGWVVGDLAGFDTLCRQIADRTGFTVVLVAYRKAPEAPYPAAAEDAWTALQWVARQQPSLAAADTPLVVSGDSAGGNLAAVVAQRATREGGPSLALQALIYPVTDADFDTASYLDPANAGMLSRESMLAFWDHYVPDSSQRRNWDAAPLHGETAGTAPALVLVAEHDVLRTEGELYAQKLRDAGVTVEEHMVPGQMHGFFTFPNVLPGAATGMDLLADAVARLR